MNLNKTLLFTSLVFLLTFLMGCSPLEKYKDKKSVFEGEVQKLEALTEYQKLDDYLLFVGSSSIRRWGNMAPHMAPHLSVKRGYGGAHFYDLIHFTERLVAPHTKAKALICFVANDISGRENDLSPAEVFRLFKHFVRQVHRLHPNLPIYFIEITPTPSRWKVWNKISQVNAKVQQYANARPKINYIETQHKFLGSNGRPVPDYFVRDSLHLSQKGYQMWSAIIKENLTQNPPAK